MGIEPRLGSKVFYKIGEVSKLAKLPAYVLRFWESEFSFLKPKKSRAISGCMSSEMWTPYWKLSACSTKKGILWPASNATGLVGDERL